MKLALCNEVIRELEFERQCALAAELGYDGLELAPFTVSEQPHLMGPDKRVWLKRAAADAGIRITSLHWLLVAPTGLHITSDDAPVRAKTVEIMRRLIDLGHDLGCTAMVHGSPKQRNLEPGVDPAEGRKRALDCFAAIAPETERAGIVYCLEPLAPTETNILNTVREAAEMIEAIGRPGIRTMIDCCAAGTAEDAPIPELIDRWMPQGMIRHFHVNDPNRKAPGQGDLAFAPIFAALKRNNYDGIVGVEPFVYQPDGPTQAARAIGYIKGILETFDATALAEGQR